MLRAQGSVLLRSLKFEQTEAANDKGQSEKIRQRGPSNTRPYILVAYILPLYSGSVVLCGAKKDGVIAHAARRPSGTQEGRMAFAIWQCCEAQMSNEHLPVDHPWAGYGPARQLLAGLDQISQHPGMRTWFARLSGALVYVAGAMLAFVVAVDGYVLLRTL
jgi:hypothetical protein